MSITKIIKDEANTLNKKISLFFSKYRSYVVSLTFLLVYSGVQAHPVIYKGGVVLNTESSENLTELHVAYSMTHRWAVGLHSIQEKNRELNFIQLAHLVKRWNGVDSQANIYAILGVGAERKFGLPTDNKWSAAQALDVMADWEDRDYYIQGMQRYVHLEGNEKNWHSRLRLGLAPFRSDSEDLGIWGIVQFDKMNEASWTMTNLLRFYYKNVLWEVGASVNGTYQINLMLHL